MKSGTLLMIAILAPGLLCLAQSQEPAATPPAPAASPATAAPAASPAPAAPAASPAPAAPVTSPAPAAPAQPGAAPNDTYVIGGNDVLSITVWKEPTLSGTILVRPDGMISIPLVGDVQATGLTPLHLADQITAKLKKYVQDPNVSVVVTQIHSKLVYMIGEVGRTGPVEMTPDMTLLEAIASAGGLSEFANKKKIYILRDEGGKRQRIPVHYKEALAGNREFDLPLQPGDTVVVP